MKGLDRMSDAYLELKGRVKALKVLDTLSADELISWVIEAMDTRYPENRKRAFELLTKRNWNDIRDEIIQTVSAQQYNEIHKLTELMSNTDLLFNKTLHDRGVIIDGSLAIITSKIGLILLTQTLNPEIKDPKLETYLLYRLFAGKPKLPNSFHTKV